MNPKYSYLRGNYRDRGWWYYYFYALAVKTPLGTSVLGIVALLGCAVSSRCRAPLRDEVALAVPMLVVLVLVCSHTGFNNNVRYALPAVPFGIVWVSRVGGLLQSRLWRKLIPAFLLCSVIEVACVYPHSLSFFNSLVGGPSHRPEHLIDSNVDWGQDLLNLRSWLDRHTEVRNIRIAYYGYVDPRVAGIEYSVPRGVRSTH
jgi:hypothetical protein